MRKTMLALIVTGALLSLPGPTEAKRAAIDYSTLTRGQDLQLSEVAGDQWYYFGDAQAYLNEEEIKNRTYSLIGGVDNGQMLVGRSKLTVDHEHRPVNFQVLRASAEFYTVIRTIKGSDAQTDYKVMWKLDRNQKRFAEAYTDRYDSKSTRVLVLTSHGKQTHKAMFPGDTSLLEFADGRVVLGSRKKTFVWRLGHGAHSISNHASVFADIPHGLLAYKQKHGKVAVTSLAKPNGVRWSAKFRPLRTSPNGKWLLGRARNKFGLDKQVVQIRRASNGSILQSYTISDSYETPVAWEGNTAVIVAAGYEPEGANVRCYVAQHVCERASDIGHFAKTFPRDPGLFTSYGYL